MQWQLIKRKVKYRNFLVLEIAFFALIFIVTVFVSSSYDLSSASIISSYVITELHIILAKYLPFLQVHVAGFQI